MLLHARLVELGLAVAFIPGLITGDSPSHFIPTGQSRTISVALRTGSETAPATAAVREALHRSLEER